MILYTGPVDIVQAIKRQSDFDTLTKYDNWVSLSKTSPADSDHTNGWFGPYKWLIRTMLLPLWDHDCGPYCAVPMFLVGSANIEIGEYNLFRLIVNYYFFNILTFLVKKIKIQ